MSQVPPPSFFGLNFEEEVLSTASEAFSSLIISNGNLGKSLLPRWKRTHSNRHQSVPLTLHTHNGSNTIHNSHSHSHSHIHNSQNTNHNTNHSVNSHCNKPHISSCGKCDISNTHPQSLDSVVDSKEYIGDRFIPVRQSTQGDKSQIFQMTDAKEEKNPPPTPEKKFQQCLKSSLLSNQPNTLDDNLSVKILTYQEKAPQPSEGYASHLSVLYTGDAASLKGTHLGAHSETHSNSRVSKHRVVSQSAERILDAPELRDCYYSNPLDWSDGNIVAVGLGSSVYLWNSLTGQIDLLFEDIEDNYVCSVKWTHTGTHIAVGMSDATVALWDIKNKKVLRRIRGHSARVGSLAWNNYIMSTGSCDSTIMNHDVRSRDSLISTFKGHEQEICGLQWDSNTNGSFLASGGNDNVVCVWEHNQMNSQERTPKHTLRESRAAVKALAWCPWQKYLLATGGGTGDMQIRFYDVISGNCVNEVSTQSQVCSLIWNPFDKEILSSHGFSKYQLSIWRYPSLIKTHDLTGHTSRVLHTTLSPDGTMVCSGAGDETLRFWKVFEKPKTAQKCVKEVTKRQSNSLSLRIR